MILIVEDHDDTRHFLERLLTKQGYQVRTAGDGTSALEVARLWVPRLFILDHNMPGMTGMELMERIREDVALAVAKVIFFSASLDPTTVKRALDMGAIGWLVKGVHGNSDILATVARALAPH